MYGVDVAGDEWGEVPLCVKDAIAFLNDRVEGLTSVSHEASHSEHGHHHHSRSHHTPRESRSAIPKTPHRAYSPSSASRPRYPTSIPYTPSPARSRSMPGVAAGPRHASPMRLGGGTGSGGGGSMSTGWRATRSPSKMSPYTLRSEARTRLQMLENLLELHKTGTELRANTERMRSMAASEDLKEQGRSYRERVAKRHMRIHALQELEKTFQRASDIAKWTVSNLSSRDELLHAGAPKHFYQSSDDYKFFQYSPSRRAPPGEHLARNPSRVCAEFDAFFAALRNDIPVTLPDSPSDSDVDPDHAFVPGKWAGKDVAFPPAAREETVPPTGAAMQAAPTPAPVEPLPVAPTAAAEPVPPPAEPVVQPAAAVPTPEPAAPETAAPAATPPAGTPSVVPDNDVPLRRSGDKQPSAPHPVPVRHEDTSSAGTPRSVESRRSKRSSRSRGSHAEMRLDCTVATSDELGVHAARGTPVSVRDPPHADLYAEVPQEKPIPLCSSDDDSLQATGSTQMRVRDREGSSVSGLSDVSKSTSGRSKNTSGSRSTSTSASTSASTRRSSRSRSSKLSAASAALQVLGSRDSSHTSKSASTSASTASSKASSRTSRSKRRHAGYISDSSSDEGSRSTRSTTMTDGYPTSYG